MIVFRLKPVGATSELPRSPLDELKRVRQKKVPVEQHLTEQMMIEPKGKPYEAKRREQKLVRELMDSLTAEKHEVCRLQLWPKGEPAPFLCDLFDCTTNTLVEAKGSIARPAFRMAIGQLADYARLVKPPVSERAILLPEKPRSDLLKLAKGEGITVIWADGKGGFATSRPASP